ncbi:hypothetical protein CDL15_Pgr019184 [Punica granatum]|nr:hypothetical protein CDL15_Pgr019184 [Punica granatum]
MAFKPLLDRACTTIDLCDPDRDPNDDEAPPLNSQPQPNLRLLLQVSEQSRPERKLLDRSS